MLNDRQLTITTASSRRSVNWERSTIMWSELCERLKTPVRSTETLQEYLGYKKARQDDLKDVGGFVGGSISGRRRKADAVTGRDLVTIDLDTIPRAGTTDILKRVGSLGCAAAVYSTRKHSEYAPRLRIVLPLNRTVTPDEYEPIARKLAEMIGIEFADPTTFEAVRLMYWPSCSSDSEYVYEIYDNPFCDADGILGLYDDWTNIASWPQVPGAEALQKKTFGEAGGPADQERPCGSLLPDLLDHRSNGSIYPRDLRGNNLSGKVHLFRRIHRWRSYCL